MNYLKLLIASTAILGSLTSEAAVINFGTLLSGTFQPNNNFASLTVTGSGDQYNFTLKADNLNSLFNNGAFIGSLAIETSPDIKLTGKGSTSLSITNVSGGVNSLTASNAGGPTGIWDLNFVLGKGANDRFTANETLSWTATFSKNVTFSDYALHVQGLTSQIGDGYKLNCYNGDSSSAWYTPTVTAVPEPETYSFMLIGLAFMGFLAKRKSN